MHSHTGVPSRINAKTAVSSAPSSSPTPLQHPVSSGESADKSGDKHHGGSKKKGAATVSTPHLRTKKPSQNPRGGSLQPVHAKSCPTSPNFGNPNAQQPPKEKESVFSKFARSFLPSSQSPATAVEAKPKRAKSTNTIQERKRSKPPKKE